MIITDNSNVTPNMTERSVVCKDPVMPTIDYSKFVSENIPVYNIPKITKPPLNMFQDEFLEQMAFPALFPNGMHGLRARRKHKLSPLQYFQSRLMSSDPRWHKDMSYLFWATNLTEKRKNCPVVFL